MARESVAQSVTRHLLVYLLLLVKGVSSVGISLNLLPVACPLHLTSFLRPAAYSKTNLALSPSLLELERERKTGLGTTRVQMYVRMCSYIYQTGADPPFLPSLLSSPHRCRGVFRDDVIDPLILVVQLMPPQRESPSLYSCTGVSKDTRSRHNHRKTEVYRHLSTLLCLSISGS